MQKKALHVLGTSLMIEKIF